MTDLLLPSAEVLFVDWAATHSLLEPLHGGRVGTRLDPVRPALRVTRLGSPQNQRWEDRPELQVEAWAETQDDADLLARSLVAALPDLPGARAGGWCSAAWVTLGPLWQPDNDTQLARYIVDIGLLTYATGGAG